MTLIRNVLSFLLVLVLVVFLLSNRNAVDVNYWPFGFVLHIALGVVLLALLAFGFIAGLLAHLPSRLAWRRRARRAEKRLAEFGAKPAAPVLAPAALESERVEVYPPAA